MAHSLHRVMTTSIPENDIVGDLHAIVVTCAHVHRQAAAPHPCRRAFLLPVLAPSPPPVDVPDAW